MMKERKQPAIYYNMIISGIFDISNPIGEELQLGNIETQIVVFICQDMDTLHVIYYN